MTFLATTEHPANEHSLAIAYQHFLNGIEAIAASEEIRFPRCGGQDNPLLRVLIIDDHRATVDTLFKLVVKWGHNVRRSYDGASGLKLAASFRPHVVLLEMLMPVVDGFQVVSQIRSREYLSSCFIVAVTGRTDALHRDRCYASGIDLFLAKPVPPSDVRTLLSLESVRAKDFNDRAMKDLPLRESVSYVE